MWEGVQDGWTNVYPWPIHGDVWQKPSQYCKVIILQLNKLKKREDHDPIFKNLFLIGG